MLKSWQNLLAAKLLYLDTFFSKCCHSKTNKDNDMKPKLVEAENTKFSRFEKRSLIFETTFEIFKFENLLSSYLKAFLDGYVCTKNCEGLCITKIIANVNDYTVIVNLSLVHAPPVISLVSANP